LEQLDRRLLNEKAIYPILMVLYMKVRIPLPLLFLLLFGNELLFGKNGIGTQSPSFLGISLIVLITDLVASVLLIRLAPQYLNPREED
jgi:hypothetical protein